MKIVIALFLFCGLRLVAQDMQSCPMHKEHMKAASQHQADVEKHGDEAMGFVYDGTTHHFRLAPDGGAIEVTVNDAGRRSERSSNPFAPDAHFCHVRERRLLDTHVRA